jgi:hypothetical protein
MAIEIGIWRIDASALNRVERRSTTATCRGSWEKMAAKNVKYFARPNGDKGRPGFASGGLY